MSQRSEDPVPAPALGWSALTGRRIGVWGLGVEGRANAARLAADGTPAAVLVDDAPPPEGVEGRTVLGTHTGGLEALAACEVVVKSPGISRYDDDARALAAAGVAVAGGLGLWLHDVPLDRVVAITGTKGKSTTTSVLGHLLSRLGRRVVVGGNLGQVPWATDRPEDAEVDRWVIEVSSYQCTDLVDSPPVVAVTSLDADHLPWHHGFENYVADKLALCSRPGASHTVAADVPTLRDRARAHPLGPSTSWVATPTAGGWAEALGLLGSHNRRNAEIARACLAALGEPAAEDPDELARLAAGFTPLPSRLTPVVQVDGVDFVDDSLSTNVLPTTAAVDAFADRRVALLVGGFDRGIDYRPLAHHLRASRTQPTLVLTLPDNGPRILAELRAAGAGEHVELRAAADLLDATATAFAWARPGGVVLLSPAAPSFGRYRDYRDRGDAFAAVAHRLAR